MDREFRRKERFIKMYNAYVRSKLEFRSIILFTQTQEHNIKIKKIFKIEKLKVLS